jgi:hypothetical protein
MFIFEKPVALRTLSHGSNDCAVLPRSVWFLWKKKRYRKIGGFLLTQSMSLGTVILLPSGDPRLSEWPDLETNAATWMQDAKRIAIGNYRQVLEDGPDKCDSESDNEYSDHGEKWPDSEMHPRT